MVFYNNRHLYKYESKQANRAHSERIVKIIDYFLLDLNKFFYFCEGIIIKKTNKQHPRLCTKKKLVSVPV